MKIAVVGTQCIGKSTYIKDFLNKWCMYTTPERTYRDVVKEKNIPINQLGTEESQQIILDFLAEQATQYSKSDNVIFDRCVLDNLAYSSWLHLNGKVSEKFLDQSRILTRETLKLFDIVFFLPITKSSPVTLVEDGLRDTDPVFREEIDNIFKAFVQSFLQGDGRVFPKGDSPPVIEIFGSPEQRIALTSMYLTDLGTPYGEDQSLVSDLWTP
jgi:nicotinamide riboside kinase